MNCHPSLRKGIEITSLFAPTEPAHGATHVLKVQMSDADVLQQREAELAEYLELIKEHETGRQMPRPDDGTLLME